MESWPSHDAVQPASLRDELVGALVPLFDELHRFSQEHPVEYWQAVAECLRDFKAGKA
jgi:hypothetical protein